MTVDYTKRKHNQFVIYDKHTGKILRTKVEGISIQMVYTTEEKAKAVVAYINSQKHL